MKIAKSSEIHAVQGHPEKYPLESKASWEKPAVSIEKVTAVTENGLAGTGDILIPGGFTPFSGG